MPYTRTSTFSELLWLVLLSLRSSLKLQEKKALLLSATVLQEKETTRFVLSSVSRLLLPTSRSLQLGETTSGQWILVSQRSNTADSTELTFLSQLIQATAVTETFGIYHTRDLSSKIPLLSPITSIFLCSAKLPKMLPMFLQQLQ